VSFDKHPELGLLGMRLDICNLPPCTPIECALSDSAPDFSPEIKLGNVGHSMMAIRKKCLPTKWKDVSLNPSKDRVTGCNWGSRATCKSVREQGYVVGWCKNIYAKHLGWNDYKEYPEYIEHKILMRNKPGFKRGVPYEFTILPKAIKRRLSKIDVEFEKEKKYVPWYSKSNQQKR